MLVCEVDVDIAAQTLFTYKFEFQVVVEFKQSLISNVSQKGPKRTTKMTILITNANHNLSVNLFTEAEIESMIKGLII